MARSKSVGEATGVVGELPVKMSPIRAASKPPGDDDVALAALGADSCAVAIGTTSPLAVVVSDVDVVLVAAGFDVLMGANRVVMAGSAAVLSAAAAEVSVPVLPVEPVVVAATTWGLGFFDDAADAVDGRDAEDFDGPADGFEGLLCAALSEFADVPGVPVSAAATP
ncbi:hypothetical protein [Mycolicibacterium komossense]|uniref:Uncharacterized protein n=1 Tax=Mycolicibacterium komossense TaxID=1779 RepID=A0ABT3CDU1_9MYCO|nr:hypothetical protein [Mycolicibacterium komossense]MCV7227562.1 hypothetical protein [Mycolicibacterium komossense]